MLSVKCERTNSLVDFTKLNKMKVKFYQVPNRDQILKEGGLAKWHRTRR